MDLAATLYFWGKEAYTATAIPNVCSTTTWMDEIDTFDDVVALRNTSRGEAGCNAYDAAILWLAGNLQEGPDPNVRWAMSFYQETDLDGFLAKLVAHGEYHLVKVRDAAAMAEAGRGDEFVPDPDDPVAEETAAERVAVTA